MIDRHQMPLSFDELCPSVDDKSNLSLSFFSRYLQKLNDDNDDFYQPISKDSLHSSCLDFIPCVFAVAKDDEKDWLQSQQFYPNIEAYENSELICLGYEVIDLAMTGASIHGISPLSDNRPNL